MMKKVKNVCATILAAAVVYLITISTTIVSYAETEVETVSIPVILNYEGDTWIDQNGNLMDMETAEDFLSNNPDYARKIFSLNQNPKYAVALQNEARSEAIKAFQTYSSKRPNGMYHSCATSACVDVLKGFIYVDALKEFIADPPTKDAFDKLLTHLQDNGACDYVEDLQYFCRTGKNSISGDHAFITANYLFYGLLAKNYDSGCVDEACGMVIMGTTSPQIPAILLADQETWLDQNGEIMDQAQAEYFLRNNKDYAQEIVQENVNSCYLPWRNGVKDNLMKQLWDKYSLSPSSHKYDIIHPTDCTWAVRDIISAPPSTEILERYCDQIRPNGAESDISQLIDYINNQVRRLDESRAPDYIFWSAVAKATENGNLEIGFENEVEAEIEVEIEVEPRPVATPNDTGNINEEDVNESEPDWTNMSHTEIIKYFDNPENPETAFDIQHPELYFDRYGRAHSADGSSDTYYYATHSGAVYEIIDHNLNPETMELGPIEYNPNLRYVGHTNRRIQ